MRAGGDHRRAAQLYAGADEALRDRARDLDGINFHELSDFSLVIVKPDRRIVYTGCNWSRIDENGTVGTSWRRRSR